MNDTKPGGGRPPRREWPRAPADLAAVALVAFGVIAAGATVIALIESYSNLLAFALVYGLHGWRAAIAPGAVDSFILMGELLLFAALLLGWPGRASYLLGGGMTAWGFTLSVAGNVWHASAVAPADRGVAAIWPVTATAGLAGSLVIVRRVMGRPGRGAAGIRIPEVHEQGVPRPGTGSVQSVMTVTCSPDDTDADVPVAQAPPPALSRRREPRRAEPSREAREPAGLAVATANAEQECIARLRVMESLPSERVLAAWPELGGSRRKAARMLAAARAERNGHGGAS